MKNGNDPVYMIMLFLALRYFLNLSVCRNIDIVVPHPPSRNIACEEYETSAGRKAAYNDVCYKASTRLAKIKKIRLQHVRLENVKHCPNQFLENQKLGQIVVYNVVCYNTSTKYRFAEKRNTF